MSVAKKHGLAQAPALMAWADLWPLGAESDANGWTEQLRPGTSVLVDECGDASPWLAVLSGAVQAARGHVVCAGISSQTHRHAYQDQVYWHNPRMLLEDREVKAQRWVQELERRWPTWSDTDWRKHCDGFELTPHLQKPLWHLSTGCLRKLGIAAALSSGARLTLIEEPTAGLDRRGIRYLSQALDALGETIANQPQLPRWVLVSHWEPLAGVTWDDVLLAPALVQSHAAFSGGHGEFQHMPVCSTNTL